MTPQQLFSIFVKIAALGVIGVTCFVVGGFLLPGVSSASRKDARANGTATPEPTPAKETAELVAVVPPVKEALAPKPAPAELPEDRPAFVEPQLPAGGGAYALSAAIDREVDKALAQANVPASPLADDAEFLRRVCLDVTGQVPSRDRVAAFLDDRDPFKRSKVIDELLASPEFGRHFANVWCDLLVKHDFDNNKNLKTDAFHGWLADQFSARRGWDRIVTDLLTAEGKEGQSPATFFLLANQDNNQPSPAKLVGASANLFLGLQLQCAECHVHPYVSKWTPKDFWGLAAFFSHVRADRERDAKGKAKDGTATFTEKGNPPQAKGKQAKKDAAKPALAGARIARPDPTDAKKTLEVIKAKYFEGPMPNLGDTGPYRPHFAKWLTSPQNRHFAAAAVNRTWALFFARGLVNPLDDMNDDNKPSHPELLRELAKHFVRSGHDLHDLVRAICNSRAYQRTSKPLPDNANDETLYSHIAVKVFSADMLLDSLAVATGQATKGSAGRPARRERGPVSVVRFFDTREYDDDPTEFSYGVPQLLRMMNSSLSNSSAEVARQLSKARSGDRVKIIEDIYLTALARRPRRAEVQKMSDYVARQGDPNKGYAGVFWALLNSAEFVSNH